MVDVITGLGATRPRRPGAGQLVRIGLVGFASGMVIPYLFLLALDVSLLTLELWGLWMGTADFGALQGQPTGGVFFLSLAHSLVTVLKHVWSFRWVGIAMGSVGMLAAVVGYYAARAGQGTRGVTFLTILALSTFVTNAAAMLFQERRSSLAAAERLVLIYYQLGKSHWAVIIVGTTVAFLLAVVIWELWRIVYGQLAYRFRLSLPSPPMSHETPGQGLTQEWHTYQDRIHQLKLEAAQPHSGLSESQGVSAMGASTQGQWWLLLLSLLIGMVLWIPLQRAYLRLAPTVTSEIVYLKPDEPMDLVRLTVGSEPKVITFSSSTGQGIADFHLEDRRGNVLHELEDFELMDLPGIAYNTATMSIADLSPGAYTLRLTLRPMKEEVATESVLGKSGGLINWSLLQGGGPWFRVLAFLIAGLTTVILINACILLTRGGNWFRDRYL